MMPLKILMIDDSEFLCQAVRKFFENYDFEVITCLNGLEGIKMATREKPDFIFLDIVMPGFNGVDVLKSLRAINECKEIPVVIITVQNEGESLEEINKMGVFKVIHKPLRRNDVFGIVDEIIGSREFSQLKIKKLFEEADQIKDVEDAAGIKKTELKNNELKQFLKSMNMLTNDLMSALESKNQFMLASVIKDLRKTGAAIGYNRLSLLSEYLENLLGKYKATLSWSEIEIYINKILELLEVIKQENSGLS